MPILLHELRHGWKALIGWTIGLISVCVLYLPFFESIGSSPEMKSMLDSLPQALIVGMGFDRSRGVARVQRSLPTDGGDAAPPPSRMSFVSPRRDRLEPCWNFHSHHRARP